MGIKVKTWLCMGLAVSMTLGSGFAAYAGAWVKGEGENQDRWRYDHQDGTFANSGWFWIDGNGDGVAESYCFDGEGWLYVNTATPDGYEVNENGAWVSEGQVMTQNVQASAADSSMAGTYYFYGFQYVDSLGNEKIDTNLRKITRSDGTVVNQSYPSNAIITVVDENTIHLDFSQDELFPQPYTYVLKKEGDGFVADSCIGGLAMLVSDLHFYGDYIKIGFNNSGRTSSYSYRIYTREPANEGL